MNTLVISRLDYCNFALSDLSSSTLQPHSSVLHSAARLIRDISPNLITPTLRQLHWLPIRVRAALKISLLTYHIHSGTHSSYIASMVKSCNALLSSLDLENSDRPHEATLPYFTHIWSLVVVISWC